MVYGALVGLIIGDLWFWFLWLLGRQRIRAKERAAAAQLHEAMLAAMTAKPINPEDPITVEGMNQLCRVFDYLAFEADAEIPAVRVVADVIWRELPIKPRPLERPFPPEHPGLELMDRLRKGERF